MFSIFGTSTGAIAGAQGVPKAREGDRSSSARSGAAAVSLEERMMAADFGWAVSMS